jgi:hypothetical protein
MMKVLLILFSTLQISTVSFSQSLKKYVIGSSGCSVYMLCDPGEFQMTYSEDSSAVFTGECKPDSVSYGIICVKLKETIPAGDDAEELLISYLDYLKTAFKIKSSAGYGKGQTLSSKADARGVLDYWNDEGGNEWKVKGWTDGKFISILYVIEKGKLEYSPKHDLFMNGFRFPEN